MRVAAEAHFPTPAATGAGVATPLASTVMVCSSVAALHSSRSFAQPRPHSTGADAGHERQHTGPQPALPFHLHSL